MVEQSEAATKLNLHEFEGLQDMLSIASNKNMLTNSLASELTGLLPSGVASVQQQWNNSVLDDISLVRLPIICLHLNIKIFCS